MMMMIGEIQGKQKTLQCWYKPIRTKVLFNVMGLELDQQIIASVQVR